MSIPRAFVLAELRLSAPSFACVAYMLLHSISASATQDSSTESLSRSAVQAALDRASHGRDAIAGIVHSRVSSVDSGLWSVVDGHAIWTLDISLPSASSVGVHADQVTLPVGTLITLSAAGTSQTYTDRDWARGELWTAAVPGDSARLIAMLPNAERSGAVVEIDSFDVGLPSPKAISRSKASTGTSSDPRINYACVANSDRDIVSRSTVDLNIRKADAVLLLTGTLVNNTGGDGTPYVLGAWHGENNAAFPSPTTERRFAWGAISPCGAHPYDGLGIAAAVYAQSITSGATIVAQYGDTVLYRLDTPAPANAYFSAIDASIPTETTHPESAAVPEKTVVVPAGSPAKSSPEFYGIHHQSNGPQQFVRDADGLICVAHNQVNEDYPGDCGSITSCDYWAITGDWDAGDGQALQGASGGGLFTSDNKIVGTATGSSTFSCSGTAKENDLASRVWGVQYMSLFSAWEGDGTPAHSLQPWLDPAHTGTRVISGKEAPQPSPTNSISVSPTSISAGSTAVLSWSSSNATSCTASGAWSGEQGAVGSVTVTPAAGSYTYTLTCSGTGGSVSSSTTLAVSAPPITPATDGDKGGGAFGIDTLALLIAAAATRRRRLDRGV